MIFLNEILNNVDFYNASSQYIKLAYIFVRSSQ